MSKLTDVTDEDWAARAARAIYHIDADNFARHKLWCDHSKQSPEHGSFNVEWPGNGSSGYLITVGKLDDRPVCVSILLDEIGGNRVLFYEATSQLVDHKMIEEWFAANLPVPKEPDGRRAHCDAMNFAHCLHAIAAARKAELASA